MGRAAPIEVLNEWAVFRGGKGGSLKLPAKLPSPVLTLVDCEKG